MTMLRGVTAIIPAIPPRLRNGLTARALASVCRQTLQPTEVLVEVDHRKEGAGAARNRALDKVATDWLAFLDDDDEWDPIHLECCMLYALESDADVIAPWFRVRGGKDPFPQNRGKPYDPEHHHTFPIDCLVRTEAVGGIRFPPPGDDVWCAAEDEPFWQQIAAGGGKILTVADRTWTWDHAPDGGNTSGSPMRW